MQLSEWSIYTDIINCLMVRKWMGITIVFNWPPKELSKAGVFN